METGTSGPSHLLQKSKLLPCTHLLPFQVISKDLISFDYTKLV